MTFVDRGTMDYLLLAAKTMDENCKELIALQRETNEILKAEYPPPPKRVDSTELPCTIELREDCFSQPSSKITYELTSQDLPKFRHSGLGGSGNDRGNLYHGAFKAIREYYEAHWGLKVEVSLMNLPLNSEAFRNPCPYGEFYTQWRVTRSEIADLEPLEIELHGRESEDGRILVSSPNLIGFSSVVPPGEDPETAIEPILVEFMRLYLKAEGQEGRKWASTFRMV